MAAHATANAAHRASPRGDGRESTRPRPPAHSEETHRRRAHHDEPLDPTARHLAQLAPPQVAGVAILPAASAPEVHARASLEHLLPALVRRIAWAGDGRRGSVRMELGSGALAGATVLVHADGGRVRVEIDAPAGADREEWKARISERLARSGLDVEHVEVT